MSFWSRLFGREAKEEPAEERDDHGELDSEPPPAPDDPEWALEQMGHGPNELLDDEQVLTQIERLRGLGREARAIDLARRVLFHHPDRGRVHLRVAEMLASRGDDEGAQKLLAPFAELPDAPIDLCMLAAEVAERRGDRAGALAAYERVVARDFDYPRARARVLRLREGDRHERDLGATLMADGALTRGRYRVERELGRGGAGTVFLAQDLSLGRSIALKVYHRRGRAERARLLVEARVPARFEHPGVVRIFDLDEGLAAITMERVVGGSVRQQLRKGDVTVERVMRWFATAAEALAHVHDKRVVHRDIKPSNMLLRADDRVVLTDFGVACDAGARPAGTAAAEGTRQYMPAEQRAGAPAHPSMDSHALGVSLAEVLAQLGVGAPAALSEITAACTREDPNERPDARWVAAQLARISAG